MTWRLILLVVIAGVSQPASSDMLRFDGSWQEEDFPYHSANEYIQEGRVLRILSDDSVSILWRRTPRELRDVRQASWRWVVRRGVPPTDLTVRGGDDRNIALYFLFVPRDRATAMSDLSLKRILRDDAVRILIYVWGGIHVRGDIHESPYLNGRGVLLTLRGAGSGDYRETVDLDADLRRAFGDSLGVLFGLGISADSDDTDSVIDAELGELVM